jgi:hypothetical protein
MKYLLVSKRIIVLFILFIPLVVFTQDESKRQIAISFVNAVNDKRFVEAESLTIDSFIVKTIYGGKDRKKDAYFISIKNKSALNQVLKVDSSSFKDKYVRLYVTSSSDFVKYIGVPELPLTYTFLFENEKISELQIDSLRGFNTLMAKNDRRWNAFENWAKIQYPGTNVTYIKLQYPDSLSKLIRQYHTVVNKK